jgi:hypothetical protein
MADGYSPAASYICMRHIIEDLPSGISVNAGFEFLAEIAKLSPTM